MGFQDSTAVLTTSRRGGPGGTTFCDTLVLGDIATAAIKQITIAHQEIVHELKVKYTWGDSTAQTETVHGYHFGTFTVLDFADDEFITGVEGYSTETYVTQLTFITNKSLWYLPVPAVNQYELTSRVGRCNPLGMPTGNPFQWGNVDIHPGSQVPRARLLAFSGTIGPYLASLQGIFYDPESYTARTSTANYQAIPATPVSAESMTSVSPIATFTSHLKAAVISLYVGPDRVEFHAHEDTLCKLQFFQAALQGSFRESASKTIAMPEDAPGTVSALLEYLYTGNYTYTYDSATATAVSQGDTTRPVANLTEARFHIGVFVIASKYSCSGLAAVAVGNFEALLPELGSVDTLRLWKHAYGEGPDMETWRKQFERCHSGSWVVAWVKELFKDHKKEMEQTIAELPELAADMMRLAICGK